MIPETKSARTPSPSRADHVRSCFEAQYHAYQYNMVEFITEHLADLSRVFRGDLQEMMVLAIIGQLLLRARKAELSHPEEASLRRIETTITASRLADVTGIPRQTVRRKLKSLEARGWIERVGDASYQLAVRNGDSPARRDLAEVDQRSIERAARLYHSLEKLLAAAPA